VVEETQELFVANKDLEVANVKVLKASAAQLQHFACLFHEIRTLRNSIIGMSNLLQDTELNFFEDEFLRMIVSSSKLLRTVVNDVLDYSKLECGSVEIEVQRSFSRKRWMPLCMLWK
jgi:signal transduction histidine kinase